METCMTIHVLKKKHGNKKGSSISKICKKTPSSQSDYWRQRGQTNDKE